VQRDGAVMAVALDARRKTIEGRPIPVHDPVPVPQANNGNSGIFVSRGGALVVARGGARGKLVWVAPDGRTAPVLPDAREFVSPRLSPDGRRIAVVVGEGGRSDVWIYDVGLSTFTRLTTLETVTSVAWMADGSNVVFTATGDDARGAVWSQLAAGGAPAEKLFEHPYLTPSAVIAPDGRSLVVTSLLEGNWSLLRVPLDSGAEARPYVVTPANERNPQFAPDGHWVALVSDESGRDEVYVRSFPGAASKIQVSVAGGAQPVWSRDGAKLYYRSGGNILVARVSLTPDFTLLGRDTLTTSVDFLQNTLGGADYDVAENGRRLLAVLADSDDFQLVVSPNWITEFHRRAADGR